MAKMVTDFLGDHVLMYASDYPHAESRFPESVDRVLSWSSLGQEALRKLMWDNAVRFYGEP
jgi:predicted TIM-barrel fold metal-dependent hydrolase